MFISRDYSLVLAEIRLNSVELNAEAPVNLKS